MTQQSQPAAQLRAPDAAALAYRLVQHRANQAGIRVIFVKGMVANHHRTRPIRNSADADVLVEPHRYQDFISLLAGDEWIERPKTLIKQTWPCDIDVHQFFPGFLAEPAGVFELLWARRDTL